jgi:hypothetical protein
VTQADHNSIFIYYAEHATNVINCIRFPASIKPNPN